MRKSSAAPSLAWGHQRPKTNATTITELKRKIGSDTSHFKTQASVQAAQEVDNENDIEDTPDEDIGDDFSPTES